ncbi:MAG TPA: hypothetical protein VEP90_10565, partial [Methylomirabilota bacterium]|nr:hypothetical protein [Methylomirabilota bacterium]
LKGNSSFFPARPSQHLPEEQVQRLQEPELLPATTTLTGMSKQASEKASKDASKHASTLAIDTDFSAVYKTLKLIGKEVLYVRLTQEEKNQVADIEYTYQRQGIKTSGNEIGRIALNILLADYKTNGEHSVLAKMLTEIHT